MKYTAHNQIYSSPKHSPSSFKIMNVIGWKNFTFCPGSIIAKVLVLSTVEVKNKANGLKMKYTLVAQSEADLKSGKISVDSPIGKGLLGKKVGEIATISVPSGKIELEILSIFR